MARQTPTADPRLPLLNAFIAIFRVYICFNVSKPLAPLKSSFQLMTCQARSSPCVRAFEIAGASIRPHFSICAWQIAAKRALSGGTPKAMAVAWNPLSYSRLTINMKQIIGIALLAVGIVLLFMAYDSYNTAASGVSRVVTGTSTDKTLWLAAGGIVASVLGLGGLCMRPGKA
jgi:hypothetical protein